MNGPRKKRRMNAPDVRGNGSFYERLPGHILLYLLRANLWLTSRFLDAGKKGSRSRKVHAAAPSLPPPSGAIDRFPIDHTL